MKRSSFILSLTIACLAWCRRVGTSCACLVMLLPVRRYPKGCWCGRIDDTVVAVVYVMSITQAPYEKGLREFYRLKMGF